MSSKGQCEGQYKGPAQGASVRAPHEGADARHEHERSALEAKIRCQRKGLAHRSSDPSASLPILMEKAIPLCLSIPYNLLVCRLMKHP